MASSDAATSSGSDYQVFLSFRGPDTRVGFTDVLFYSLTDAGICVFRDDEELRVGERIDGSLLQAIDNSRIYIPIFSRNYASSQWCLRELAQIVANTFKSEGNKVILPIFFDVKPDDVKLKTPLYRDAILNLEHEKKLSNELVNAWREALMEIDAIKGWEVKKYKGHGELIRMVVEEVVEKLKTKHRSVTEHFVGIDDQVAAISKLLDVNSNGVRLIKIHGMGGIGKTTLAKVVFNQFSSHFGKCCCFLEDVRAKSSKTDGLVDLQRRLLSEIGHPAGTRSINEIDYGMKRAGEVLGNKKVLVVLDDVDSNEQVEKLVGKTIFYSGSRILITTRNKDVLQTNAPKYQILDYEMEVMSTDHALELFNRHALNKTSPLDDYNDVSRKIVYALGRLPLALEVIGSSLYHKPQEIWNETLEKLRKAPANDVFGKLKIGYDALCFEQQQIFLDIACFFIDKDKTNAIYMWKDCGFFPDTGVAVLINMSLIKIVEENKSWMHDQLRDLERKIVHQENPINPKERSRIWIWDEGLEALRSREMNNNVQALSLEAYGRHPHNVIVRSEEIERFERLRFLKLSGLTLVGDAANHLTKLRWISLSSPPQINKWPTMSLKNVVVLEFNEVDFLDDSRLQSLIKMAAKLKVLSLKLCWNITRTPDFSGCPNLERLTFEDCSKLRKIDGSIGKLKCLIDLKIHNCNSLKHLPEEIGDLVNLQYFFVACSGIKKLPGSIWKMKSLRELHFQGNIYEESDPANSWELPSAIGMLQNLEVLQVNSGSLKGELASGIGSLPFLRILNLSRTGITGIPKSISMLPRLQRIELVECDMIQELPTLPTSLTHLEVSSKSLLGVPDLSNLTNLVELDLSDGGGYVDDRFPPEKGVGDKLLPTGELGWIGKLSKLTKLSIRLHKVPIPTEMASLPLLNELALFNLDLQTFPQLPLSLQKLSLNNVNIVGSLSPNLRNLSCLHIRWSPTQEIQLDGLQLPQLEELLVRDCGYLERLSLSRMRKLREVKVFNCPKLVEIQFSAVFESLEALSIEVCDSFERIVYESADELISCEGRLIFPSRVLSKLRNLALLGCPKILGIQVVGASESWEVFKLWDCPNLQSLGGLANLKNLKSLDIRWCERLRVVEGVDELEFLGQLALYGCGSLERLIEVSTTKLPNDCHVSIRRCRRLRGIKKRFIGSVQSLKHYKDSRFNWTTWFGRS
ncbi:disease resistance protein L6-like [Rhodamnia argentea]|uniref:Disease resistance protein L6-like n=1 Tax=Rhodamnia argentea TaxID=178133 RepID=A0ABM3HY30_9MYRT|nr:disease resistance protein L6-like [Rhodamnia argentea]